MIKTLDQLMGCIYQNSSDRRYAIYDLEQIKEALQLLVDGTETEVMWMVEEVYDYGRVQGKLVKTTSRTERYIQADGTMRTAYSSAVEQLKPPEDTMGSQVDALLYGATD